jgi:hypothetical protein
MTIKLQIRIAITACLVLPGGLARLRPEIKRLRWQLVGRTRASFCVVREQTIPAVGGTLTVDGRQNGGVSVKGWDRAEILVKAKVQTWADTDSEAQALANQIQVQTSGAQIRAEGPSNDGSRHLGWAVSFELFVPINSDLSLKAHNGGINVAGVRGRIDFETVNGGVSLRQLAGAVHGQTVNGGVSIELSGDRWDGEGIDVKTTNGGVNLVLPENYSARLEASTVHGGFKVDVPVTMGSGRIERNLAVDLGSGGSLLRVTTTNGGVTVKRKA